MKAKLLLPAALAAILLTATGCKNPYQKEFAWTEESLLKQGWIETRRIHGRRIYCYRTLAEAECFKEPLEGEETRLIGFYGIAPE